MHVCVGVFFFKEIQSERSIGVKNTHLGVFVAQGLTGYPLSWRGCVQHRSILSPRPAGLFLAQSPTYRARLRPASDPCCASVCTPRHRAHVHREMLLYTDMYQISARKIFRLNIYYKNKFKSWVTATWSLPGSCAGLVTARPVTSECTVYTGCPGSSPAFASLSHTHRENIQLQSIQFTN